MAYCSSLKKAEIVEVYQKYLDRWSEDADAVANLCDFLDVEDLDEVVLIAANFRKEVTTTVLWLIGHGVRAQCFRVVPYSFGEELFIDLRQIIPTPEAADYMIGMAAKDSEEKSVEGAQRHSHRLRQAFWTGVLEELRTRNVAQFDNVSPSTDYYVNLAAGVAGCHFALIFLRTQARVELNLQRSDATENKWLFDQLKRQKHELEGRFGNELRWRRMDERKASRINYSCSFDSYDEKNWPRMTEWMCEHIVRLVETFSEPLNHLNLELKTRIGTSPDEGDATASASED